MSASRHEYCVAIDGGTTNTRARLLSGSVVRSAGTRAVGVRDVATSGSTEKLHRAVADCVQDAIGSAGVPIQDIALFCASGMLTSNVGLHEVPHVPAPAGMHELARSIALQTFPDIAPKPIHFIPGVKTVPGSIALSNLQSMDVLRGEECEVFGILQAIRRIGPLCIMLPGSHTKLLLVDSQSRIAASYTTIGGELMQALAQHSILASSIEWPPPGEPLWTAVEAGAEFARKWGISRGSFAVRLADVVIGTERRERSWFFVGLVIGNDWMELARWTHFDRAIPMLVAGREPLRSIFGHLSQFAIGRPAEVLDDSIVDAAAAVGAATIARLKNANP